MFRIVLWALLALYLLIVGVWPEAVAQSASRSPASAP